MATSAYRPRLEVLEDRLLLSHGAAGPFAGENEGGAEQSTDTLNVVTYDVDPGSRLAPLLAASSPQALPAAMSQVWAEVQASDVPGRAEALAREIAWAGPDVAGIQDAAVWSVNGAPRYDFLRLLRQDLRARGQNYVVLARQESNGLQLPDAAGDRIGYVDQTVILGSGDLAARGFYAGHRAGGTFASQRTVQAGGPQGLTLALQGSWACVNLLNTQDADHALRFVTAQLDAVDPAVNSAQGGELLALTARTALPVVAAGDFGTPPGESTSYQQVLQAGFNDTWLRLHAAQPGPTSAEPDLRDPGRHLQARTDLVFLKRGEDMSDQNAFLLGTLPSDRTRSGLWPSDHAGVLAHLVLP